MAYSILLMLAAQAAPAIAEPPVDWDKEFGVEEKVRDPVTGEFPVEPYAQSNANAAATPFRSSDLKGAFGGQEGIRGITDRLVELSQHDPRISEIFVSHDMVRLRRTLFEQFCFILNAGCTYSGRDMVAVHKDMGLQKPDLNALVENLQQAMREARVPFAAQNAFLSKLAPMDRDVLDR